MWSELGNNGTLETREQGHKNEWIYINSGKINAIPSRTKPFRELVSQIASLFIAISKHAARFGYAILVLFWLIAKRPHSQDNIQFLVPNAVISRIHQSNGLYGRELAVIRTSSRVLCWINVPETREDSRWLRRKFVWCGEWHRITRRILPSYHWTLSRDPRYYKCHLAILWTDGIEMVDVALLLYRRGIASIMIRRKNGPCL